MAKDDQTLQGMQKEMTQAINTAAKASKKEDREAAANKAKQIEKKLFKMLHAYQKGAQQAQETLDDE